MNHRNVIETPDGVMNTNINQTDLLKGAIGGGISTQVLLTVAAIS